MAFTRGTLRKLLVGMDGSTFWYYTTSDAGADIQGGSYFNNTQDILKQGDPIWVNASDAKFLSTMVVNSPQAGAAISIGGYFDGVYTPPDPDPDPPVVSSWYEGEYSPDTPETFDYFVSPSGDNSDGLTLATAFNHPQTAASAAMAGASPSEVIRIRVLAGTYGEQGPGAVVTFGPSVAATYEMYFDSNVIIEKLGVDANVSALESLNGDLGATVRYIGNNTIIRGFNTGTGNGLSANNGGRVEFYSMIISDVVDGASAHGSATLAVYDSQISDYSKGGFVSISTSVNEAYNVSITTTQTGTSGGIVQMTDTATFYGENITLDTGGANANGGISVGGATTFVDSKIGSLTTLAVASAISDGAEFRGCFVNLIGDLRSSAQFRNCYGFMSVSIRGVNADNAIFDHCTFVGEIVSSDGSAFRNRFNANDGNWAGIGYTITNSIFTGYTGTAIGQNMDAEQLSAWNADSSIDTCILFNNGTDINAGILTDTNIVTLDPLLPVAAGSVDFVDYLPLSGPAIDAGTDGLNIGVDPALTYS